MWRADLVIFHRNLFQGKQYSLDIEYDEFTNAFFLFKMSWGKQTTRELVSTISDKENN
jgi:hypothetical protein